MEQQNNTSDREYQVDAILRQLQADESPDAAGQQAPPPAPIPPAQPETETASAPPNALRKKKSDKKAKSCLTTFIWLFLIVAVSVGLAVMAIFAVSDYLGVGKDFLRGEDTRSVQIYVEEGASINEIALQLEEEDVLINRHVFLLYLKLTGKGDNMNYGAHDFSTKMGYGEILDSLAQPAKAEDVTVTIPSAKTVEEILNILEDAGVCSYADLRTELLNGTFDSPLWAAIPENEAIYYAAEGYLFPDTYNFYLNDDAHRVIQKMLDNLEEKFTPEMRQAAADRGYTTHEILTMASIIELESCGYFEEMPKVSAVFYNRLEDWPAGTRLLQSDPTMYYPYGNGAYNTYQKEGIPPGPMSNATEAALSAAVYPDETVKAYYFVTDANGKFYYNDTLAAHEATIAELKQKGVWLES